MRTPKQYRLLSTQMFHTPGMIRLMQALPQAQGRKMFKAGWPTLPSKVRNGILDGSIKFTVENETVVFTA